MMDTSSLSEENSNSILRLNGSRETVSLYYLNYSVCTQTNPES